MTLDPQYIYEKINAIDGKLNYLAGRLDAIVPTLATKSEISSGLFEHKRQCELEFRRRKTRAIKIWGVLVGSATALTGTVIGIISMLQ